MPDIAGGRGDVDGHAGTAGADDMLQTLFGEADDEAAPCNQQQAFATGTAGSKRFRQRRLPHLSGALADTDYFAAPRKRPASWRSEAVSEGKYIRLVRRRP